MEKIKQERIIISHYFCYFIMLHKKNKFTFFIKDISNLKQINIKIYN